MAGNTIGKVFKLTTFGESHSDFVGGVIDGCPACLTIDMDFINSEIQRRKPTQKDISTPRKHLFNSLAANKCVPDPKQGSNTN